jgi:hypothetical protein
MTAPRIHRDYSEGEELPDTLSVKVELEKTYFGHNYYLPDVFYTIRTTRSTGENLTDIVTERIIHAPEGERFLDVQDVKLGNKGEAITPLKLITKQLIAARIAGMDAMAVDFNTGNLILISREDTPEKALERHEQHPFECADARIAVNHFCQSMELERQTTLSKAAGAVLSELSSIVKS